MVSLWVFFAPHCHRIITDSPLYALIVEHLVSRRAAINRRSALGRAAVLMYAAIANTAHLPLRDAAHVADFAELGQWWGGEVHAVAFSGMYGLMVRGFSLAWRSASQTWKTSPHVYDSECRDALQVSCSIQVLLLCFQTSTGVPGSITFQQQRQRCADLG